MQLHCTCNFAGFPAALFILLSFKWDGLDRFLIRSFCINLKQCSTRAIKQWIHVRKARQYMTIFSYTTISDGTRLFYFYILHSGPKSVQKINNIQILVSFTLFPSALFSRFLWGVFFGDVFFGGLFFGGLFFGGVFFVGVFFGGVIFGGVFFGDMFFGDVFFGDAFFGDAFFWALVLGGVYTVTFFYKNETKAKSCQMKNNCLYST